MHRQLPHGEDLDDEGTLLAVLDGTAEIKDDLREIFEMVSKSMAETFSPGERPDRLPNGITSAEDTNLAYWLLLASLKVSTDSFIPRPESPLEGVLDDIIDAVEQFLDNVSHPPTPPSAPSDTCFAFWRDDCDFSLDKLVEWLEHLWDGIVYLGELIAWAASVLKDLFDILMCTITAPLKAAVASLLWLIQSALYAILEEIREALVLAAIVHPQPEWVSTNPIAQSIVDLSNRSWQDVRRRMYPRRAQPSNEPFLGYPTTRVENEPTVAGPYPPGANPASILNGVGLTNDQALYKEYAESNSPKTTRKIEFATMQVDTLPAIDLAMDIFVALRDDERVIPDWNLDADRGYHYKNWKADWARLKHDFEPDSASVDEEWV